MIGTTRSKAKASLAKANRVKELTDEDVVVLDNKISALNIRLTALENRLVNYENHTHNYIDTTIEDTDDGSGVATDTTKITGIVI